MEDVVFLDEDVRIPLDVARLDARLSMPTRNSGVVVFAHGSGSGRHSPRNRHVAELLQREHLGTVLLDLLTPDEERRDAETRELRFDIPVLAGRLAAVVDWLADQVATGNHPIGLFGASTGAAAALVAAAERPAAVRAVVSRGGRPDLAGDALTRVLAPTLLIVGERDEEVVELNRQAARRLGAGGELEVVPGAGHLFEEPGALDHVARSAARWFHRNVGSAPVS
ncbi:dienelactone hydrolase family protein [Actinosynnema sp. CS-041913]|uniref:dienelactone hydrolase family protein n=1 Tax=Actinosynnema sp. CS-041913 TaxID=3239917 RepID=UPI003D8E0BB7